MVEQNVTDIPNDPRLLRYLLGSLPAEEAEHLDELSVTDDDFAARLNEAENDLVDAYARGKLSAETAEQFDKVYLSTPGRCEKVRFAETFFSLQQSKAASAASSASTWPAENRKHRWRFPAMPWLFMQWGFAGAALLLLVTSGYLLTSNLRLRQRIDSSEQTRISLERQAQDLKHQVETQAPVTPPTSSTKTEQPSEDRLLAKLELGKLKVAAFVLLPSFRDSNLLPSVSVASDTDLVVIRLQLETNDFPRYRVAIQEPATRRSLWTSSDLKSFRDGEKRFVSFAFPPNILKAQNYMVQLKGVLANGTAELVSTYPFKGVVK
jgi:hypothetical protein